MDFYFCETCGKRLTSVDLEQGSARNKKLKGVYCQQCSVGVTTVEFEAIKHGAPEPPASEAPPKSQQASGRIPDRVSKKAANPATPGILWPVVGGSGIVIVGLLAVAGSRSSSESAKS